MASTEPKVHYADSDWEDTLCGKPISGNLQATYSAGEVTCLKCKSSPLIRHLSGR